MNDYLMHSMMRSRIESKIARASARVESRIDHMSGMMATGMVKIRTDMLEGFGHLRETVEGVSTRLDSGLHQLNMKANTTHAAVKALGMSVDLLSDNMIAGFTQTWERLDRIENEIAVIKHGVLNPSETLALERGRIARGMAERGEVREALGYVSGAIEPKDGLPMRHMVSLRMLRGALLSGVYDTARESVIDPQAARTELTDALRYADAESLPLVQDHLGVVVFGMQDYQGAYGVYEEMAANKGKIGAAGELNQARCLLMIGRQEAAADLIRSAITRDRTLVIQIATDPVCMDHHEMVAKIVAQTRTKAFQDLGKILSDAETDAARAIGWAQTVFDNAFRAYGGAMGVPEKVKPLLRALPQSSPCGTAKLAYVLEVNPRWGKDALESVMKKAFLSAQDQAGKHPATLENVMADKADWDQMKHAALRARDVIASQKKLYADHVLPVLDKVAHSLSPEGAFASVPTRLIAEATLSAEEIESLREKRPTGLFAFRQKEEYDRTALERDTRHWARIRTRAYDFEKIAAENLTEAQGVLTTEMASSRAQMHDRVIKNRNAAQEALTALQDASVKIEAFVKAHDLDAIVPRKRVKSAHDLSV